MESKGKKGRKRPSSVAEAFSVLETPPSSEPWNWNSTGAEQSFLQEESGRV